jgi:sarcosine oxidase subunit delta
MLIITCPYCREERTELELTFGGEADVIRPAVPGVVSDEKWAEYLYFRDNRKGAQAEQWCCSGGCGQWFKVVRDTVSHQVLCAVPYDHVLTRGYAA